VLLPLPNLVPHPVSFHIAVLVFSENEIAIILFFAAIMICSVILESIYFLNNLKCYSYRCCSCSFYTNDLGWVHICWKSSVSMKFTDYPWEKTKILLFVVWLAVVIFVKSHLSSKSLFVCLWVLRTIVRIFVGRHRFSNRESIRMIAAYFCRTDSNISTTCFKRSRRRGEVVLTAYHLTWDNV
jgi:hypothetical protein